MTRSGNVFLMLHEISKEYPDLRAGQILTMIGLDVTAAVKNANYTRYDSFQWETTEWIKRIKQIFPKVDIDNLL